VLSAALRHLGSCRVSRWRLVYRAAVVSRVVASASLALLLASPYVEGTRVIEVGPDSQLLAEQGVLYVLVVDVSRSMSYGSPSRLSRALELLDSLLRQLSSGDRVAVVAFAGEAELLYAGNASGAREALGRLAADRKYTSIGDALLSGLNAARAMGLPAAAVLVSDGGNNGGSDPVEAAREALNAGVPVSAVYVGGGVSSNLSLMRNIAEAGGGRLYYATVSHEALASLAAEAAREVKYTALVASGRAEVEVPYRDYDRPAEALLGILAVSLAVSMLVGA